MYNRKEYEVICKHLEEEEEKREEHKINEWIGIIITCDINNIQMIITNYTYNRTNVR